MQFIFNPFEFITSSKTNRNKEQQNEKLKYYHMLNMTRKTISMFEYENLPNTIPKRVLELRLQFDGHTTIFKHNGNIYCSYGALGSNLNYNYMPTKSIIANPYIPFNKALEIDKECVVIPNDSLYMGLVPINDYYSTQLVDNDLSRATLLKSLRAMNLAVATNKDDKENIDAIFKALETGELKAILSKSFEDKIYTLPYGQQGSSQTIIQLLEDKQYIKGSWLNELGVQSNYNMKRETITANENMLNIDNLLPLTDDMYNARSIGIKQVNEMFGTNIKFDFSSAWKKLRDEINKIEQVDNGTDVDKTIDIVDDKSVITDKEKGEKNDNEE